MQQITNKEVFLNLFKQPLLRYTLLITVITVTFLPVYSFYYIFPQFNNQLTKYTQDAAIRVATHLKETIFIHGTTLTQESFSNEVSIEILKLKTDLRIEKIKIFSETGIVLFSSNPKDIGQKNDHDYFYNKIALGFNYSKLVKKNTKTLEGRIVNAEVVESYIPLMQQNIFKGAVEVYYDITENYTDLTMLLNRLQLIISFFTITFLIILLTILIRASRSTIVRQMAETSLQHAHSELELLVAERTKDLEMTNRSLLHEIKERINVETSLQRSYDTQTIINQLMRESLGDASLLDIIRKSLDLVLSLPWLSFDSMGCIYLVEDKSDVLVLKAQKGFSNELLKICSTVPFGKCLCGRAAIEQQSIFASHIDDRHDIRLPTMTDHGHYCIPIIAKGVTLGVITIYVKSGHKHNAVEEDFLKAVANTMAGILIQRFGEIQQKEIEKRLHQSQKMESIGTLAGGIAHDFNNILSGIFGHAQLTLMSIDDPEKIKSHIGQINKGAKRATDLIQQILTFSRQTEHEKTPIKIYLIIKEAIKFLRSSIPSNININENIASKSIVKADPTQIHQIVMNLCTNAYHTMKNTGGELSISLSDIEIQKQVALPDFNIVPGKYLILDIQDTGAGMTPEILSKIFEPYFTTKTMSEGTGLGLAVVLGIIENHDGYIKADSTVGKGTTFHVYLPLFEDNVISPETTKTQKPIKGGSERIMIVDDEKSIIDSTSELLSGIGYHVESFSDPQIAYNEFKENINNFDLIITDMTMPNMTGDQFAKKVFALRKIPIILCTGYTTEITKDHALDIGIKSFFTKPVDYNKLIFAIRKILDEKPNNAQQ